MAANSLWLWQIGCRGGSLATSCLFDYSIDAGWRADIFFRHSLEFPDTRPDRTEI